MPWRETTPMDERMQFVADARRGHDDMLTLCRRYDISRKTGYKLVARYAAGGVSARLEQSRRPHDSPRAPRSRWSAAWVVYVSPRVSSAFSEWKNDSAWALSPAQRQCIPAAA